MRAPRLPQRLPFFVGSSQEPEFGLSGKDCEFKAPHICSDCGLKIALVCGPLQVGRENWLSTARHERVSKVA